MDFPRDFPQERGSYRCFTPSAWASAIATGDGRLDLLEASGWWEQPEKLDGDPVWKKHEFKFADTSAEMYAFDIDGDGDADIVTATHAHQYGIACGMSRLADDKGEIVFIKHPITSDKRRTEKINGVQFSESGSMAIADMDGDGLPDLGVTGKRHWARWPCCHRDRNPVEGRAVLYWFKLVSRRRRQNQRRVYFELLISIDDNSAFAGSTMVACRGRERGWRSWTSLSATKKPRFTFCRHFPLHVIALGKKYHCAVPARREDYRALRGMVEFAVARI